MGAIQDLLYRQDLKIGQELIDEIEALEVMAVLQDWRMDISYYVYGKEHHVNFHKGFKMYSIAFCHDRVYLGGDAMGLANIVKNMAIADLGLEESLKDCLERMKNIL